MDVQITGSYRKAGTGNLVFRGIVNGSEAELADYKATQGSNYVQDEKTGKPLFFTTRPIAERFKLVKTRGTAEKPARYIADSSDMDLKAAIVKNLGGNLGQEIAKITASQLLFGNSTVSAPAAAVEAGTADLNQA